MNPATTVGYTITFINEPTVVAWNMYVCMYVCMMYVCMYVYRYMNPATTVGSLLKVIVPTVVARGVYVCMFICMSA